MVDDALNVRDLRSSDRDRHVFAAYEALTVDETMVVVGDGDPQPLSESLQAEYPGSVGWVRLECTADDRPGTYRVAITKRTATPLPRVLVNTAEIAAGGRRPAAICGSWTCASAAWTPTSSRYRHTQASAPTPAPRSTCWCMYSPATAH